MLDSRVVDRARSWMLAVPVLMLIAAASPAAGPPAPAGPIDLSGTWSLDIYLSDHSEQIARAIRIDSGEFAPETAGRGAEPPDAPGRSEGVNQNPFGSTGRSGRGREPQASHLKPEESKLLAEVARPVLFPRPTLTITQAEGTVTLTGGQGASETLRTDGKGEKQSFESGSANRSAAWEGPQLRVAYEVGRIGTLTYVFSIVPTTRQLLVRVNFERIPGTPGPFEIKLVYNRTTPAAN